MDVGLDVGLNVFDVGLDVGLEVSSELIGLEVGNWFYEVDLDCCFLWFGSWFVSDWFGSDLEVLVVGFEVGFEVGVEVVLKLFLKLVWWCSGISLASGFVCMENVTECAEQASTDSAPHSITLAIRMLCGGRSTGLWS